jgi:putative transcriptional regulator
MSPRHHPTEELLLAYAGGAASEGLGLCVATHLSGCPRCAREVALAEALGGAALEEAAPAELAKGGLDRLLAALDAPPPPSPPSEPLAALGPSWLPEPLRSVVGPIDPRRWRSVVPGVVWSFEIPLSGAGPSARLTRMRGGFDVPSHTHRGLELNLVVAGGFQDRGESYGPGDLACNDDTIVHHLEVDRGEPCVMLVVNEAPLVPVGAWSKLVGAFTGGY